MLETFTTKNNALEIARQYFPGWDDDTLGDIIWNETGYPCFWRGDPEECFRLQLAKAACRELYSEYGYWDGFRLDQLILSSSWGLYDTQDRLWIENAEGPVVCDDLDFAYEAADVVDKHLGQVHGRTKPRKYIEKPVSTRLSDLTALKLDSLTKA